MGAAIGIPGLGYAITIAIGSPMLDYLGMGTSAVALVGAVHWWDAGGDVCGLDCLGQCGANGRVDWDADYRYRLGAGRDGHQSADRDAVSRSEKTARLNTLHAWWPGGIIIGGLVGLGIGQLHMGWQAKMAIVLIPAAVTTVLCLTSKFPPTERIAAGLPASVMFKEVTKPFFLVWFFAMFLTAASELAPGQWVNFALSETVHMPAILLLVYASAALMFVMRHLRRVRWLHKLP